MKALPHYYRHLKIIPKQRKNVGVSNNILQIFKTQALCTKGFKHFHDRHSCFQADMVIIPILLLFYLLFYYLR